MEVRKIRNLSISGKRQKKKNQPTKMGSFLTDPQVSSPIQKSSNPIDFSLSFKVYKAA